MHTSKCGNAHRLLLLPPAGQAAAGVAGRMAAESGAGLAMDLSRAFGDALNARKWGDTIQL